MSELRVLNQEEWQKLRLDVIGSYGDWYFNDTTKLERRTAALALTALLLGVLATVLAAYPNDLLPKYGASHPDLYVHLLKWSVVVATTIATTAASAAARYSALARLRDRGRIAVALLEGEIRTKVTLIPMSDADRAELILAAIAKIADIEQQFGGEPGEGKPR